MTTANDNSTDSPNPPNSLSITDAMLRSLSQTKPWTRFVSIVGFVAVGFMVIMGGISMAGFSKINAEKSIIPFLLIGVINILMGLLYFFPSLFLFRFSSSINRLLNGGGSSEMEDALSNQKSFWKFVGILTIISLSFAIIGIAAAIIIPQFAIFAGK